MVLPQPLPSGSPYSSVLLTEVGAQLFLQLGPALTCPFCVVSAGPVLTPPGSEPFT